MSTQDRHSLPPEEPLSDAEFDAYLLRDSQVSQHYREHHVDTAPPPSLDRVVLSQAHAAAAGTKRSRILRWGGPLALAASVVVVVSLVFEPSMQKEIAQSAMPAAAPQPALGVESGKAALDESSLETRMPQSAERSPPAEAGGRRDEPQQPAGPTSAPLPEPFALGKVASDAEKKATAKAEESHHQMANAARQAAAPPPLAVEMPSDVAPTTAIRQTATIAPVAAPAPSAAVSAPAGDSAAGASSARNDSDESLREITATAARRQQANAGGAGPRGTIPLSRARQEADARDKVVEQETPAAWLERIRELRRAGRRTAADREWQLFVKQYPDYVVDAADMARPPKK